MAAIRSTRVCAVLLAVATCLAAVAMPNASAARQAEVLVDDLSVHLLLEKSGTVSQAVDRIKDLVIWNGEPQGDGIASNERTSAILIKVRLKASAEVFASGRQGEVLVHAEKPSSRFPPMRINDVYIGPDRSTTRFFMIKDLTCVDLNIDVRGRGRSLTRSVHFSCGE